MKHSLVSTFAFSIFMSAGALACEPTKVDARVDSMSAEAVVVGRVLEFQMHPKGSGYHSPLITIDTVEVLKGGAPPKLFALPISCGDSFPLKRGDRVVITWQDGEHRVTSINFHPDYERLVRSSLGR